MSSKPNWYIMLPEHLRPPDETLDSLEMIRLKYGLSDDMFSGGISISPWAATKALEMMLQRFRIQFPEKNEKELWQGVIFSWFEGLIKYQYNGIPPEHILNKLESIEPIINKRLLPLL